MGVSYKYVIWNKYKKSYDKLIALAMILYILVFALEQPNDGKKIQYVKGKFRVLTGGDRQVEKIENALSKVGDVIQFFNSPQTMPLKNQ